MGGLHNVFRSWLSCRTRASEEQLLIVFSPDDSLDAAGCENRSSEQCVAAHRWQRTTPDSAAQETLRVCVHAPSSLMSDVRQSATRRWCESVTGSVLGDSTSSMVS